ncbi:hypothetical protein Tco_0652161 [Tanacetum coccineum]|uniref:Uncharacterized protein n=1 Tax=Tanacetum coccineum TaxID=301880 RepID=A0ABQ4WWT3_9ASTR
MAIFEGDYFLLVEDHEPTLGNFKPLPPSGSRESEFNDEVPGWTNPGDTCTEGQMDPNPENLKLLTEGEVRLEEPASSAGTLSSLQNLDKELSFTNQFLAEKPQEDEPKKTNIEAEVQSMVTVPIHQDTSNRNSNNDNNNSSSTTSTTTRLFRFDLNLAHRLYKLENLDIPHQVSKAVDEIVMDAVDWAIQAPLEGSDICTNSLEQSMARDHTDQLLTDLAEARKKKKKRHDSTENSTWVSTSSATPSSSHLRARSIWNLGTSEGSSILQLPNPSLLASPLDPPTRVRQIYKHLAASKLCQETVCFRKSLLAQIGDMAIFMDWFCKKQGITEYKQQDLEGPTYEIVKVFHPNVIHLQYQIEECHKLLIDQVDESLIRYNVSKPLQLGGPLGQVTIQSDFFFNKDLEYLRYSRKSGRPALSISKIKAAYYPDVGLEQMVPDQMWIEEECKYDIAAMYGISH